MQINYYSKRIARTKKWEELAVEATIAIMLSIISAQFVSNFLR